MRKCCHYYAILMLGAAGTASAAPRYTVTDLGDLAGGGDQSFADGINDTGQVVGDSGAATGYRAFLWEDNNMLQLDSLIDPQDPLAGMTLSDARGGINGSGQIAATGSFNGGPTHAYLLTPTASVPEPGTLGLLGAGLMGLGLASRHRQSAQQSIPTAAT